MKGFMAGLMLCVLAAGCSSGKPAKMFLIPPKGVPALKGGMKVREAIFVDHQGISHELSDYIKGRDVVIFFAPCTDPEFKNYIGVIDGIQGYSIRVIQVVSTPAGQYLEILNDSMDPKEIGDAMFVCLVDAKGLLCRELGVGQGRKFVTVNHSGVALDVGELADTGYLEKSLERLKKNSAN